MLHGWALVEQGSFTEGIDQMQKGLADFRGSNSEARLPYYLTLLAEAYGNAGQVQEGVKHLAEALDFAEKNNDEWYCAETHRLMGDLMRHSGESEKAESCFQKSLDISRRQKARTLELRATVSLAQLWLEQNQQEKARVMLEEIFNWFSEGFDTVDLKVARKLLDEVS